MKHLMIWGRILSLAFVSPAFSSEGQVIVGNDCAYTRAYAANEDPVRSVGEPQIAALAGTGEAPQGSSDPVKNCGSTHRVKLGGKEFPSPPLCVGRIACRASKSRGAGSGDSKEYESGFVYADVVCPSFQQTAGIYACPRSARDCLAQSLLPKYFVGAAFIRKDEVFSIPPEFNK